MQFSFSDAVALFQQTQSTICTALETADGTSQFVADAWQRQGGGGGVTRVLEGGQLFEKGGVNFSHVHGELPEALAGAMPGEGNTFQAAGISIVLHPHSPMIPTTHANFRCIQRGSTTWFGGGADLTPYYLFEEDAQHFHKTWKNICDDHKAVADYPKFKKWCDDYFYLPHRKEHRGIGGIFFDYLAKDQQEHIDKAYAFAAAAANTFLGAYMPIVNKRKDLSFTDAQKRWQLIRRGRYVEFNLLYDRGTLFGLKTDGRIESIFMSLPPHVDWAYDVKAQSNSEEQKLLTALTTPREWILPPSTD